MLRLRGYLQDRIEEVLTLRECLQDRIEEAIVRHSVRMRRILIRAKAQCGCLEHPRDCDKVTTTLVERDGSPKRGVVCRVPLRVDMVEVISICRYDVHMDACAMHYGELIPEEL